jgi:hypothetical protein
VLYLCEKKAKPRTYVCPICGASAYNQYTETQTQHPGLTEREHGQLAESARERLGRSRAVGRAGPFRKEPFVIFSTLLQQILFVMEF